MQLVINTHGTQLRRKGERFVLKTRSAQRAVELAAKRIQSIVIASGTQLSSQAVQLAIENNVDIVFLDKTGHPTARVWQTRMGSTVTIRRRQLEASDGERGIEFVRQWTTAKIDNQIGFLEQLARRRERMADEIQRTTATLTNCRDQIATISGPVTESRGTLMGCEGTAGRVYFACLGRLMPSEYRFSGRSRRPAVDPFNAMLNYTYGILYSLVERSCILAGLDPFIGFLHTDNYNKRSLVFDMIEPFRILGERATVLFFTGRRVKKDFFREVPGGIELAPDGRAALVENFNQRLDKSVRYPVQRAKQRGGKKYRRIKQREVIQHEAHALANRLLGKDDIPRIVNSDVLLSEQEE